MEKRILLISLILLPIFFVSFISEGFFSDFYAKITGKVVLEDSILEVSGSPKITCSDYEVSIAYIYGNEAKLEIGRINTPILKKGDVHVLGGKDHILKILAINSRDNKIQFVEEFVLKEGDYETTGINCGNYEITINFINKITREVKLNIKDNSNVELTFVLNEGETYTLTDGSNLTVSDIMFGSKEGEISKAEINITKNEYNESKILEEGKIAYYENLDVFMDYISPFEVKLGVIYPNIKQTPLLMKGDVYKLANGDNLTISHIDLGIKAGSEKANILISINMPSQIINSTLAIDIPPDITDAKIFPSIFASGASPIINVNIIDIDPLDGISIENPPQALIQNPDENTIAIVTLYDDGVHEDLAPGDGIYGNVWDSDTQPSGKYFVDIIAEDTLNNSVEEENILQFSISDTDCVQVINNGPSNTKLDVIFIGTGLPTITDWAKVVEEFIDYDGRMNGLLSVEPFRTNKNKFNFWRIDNLYNFSGDNSDPNYWAFVWRDRARETCTFADNIVLLSVNLDVWPSSSISTLNGIMEGDQRLQMSIGSQYLTDTGWPLIIYDKYTFAFNKVQLRAVFIHEFGHSFGGLYDEYLYNNPPAARDPPGYNCAAAGCEKWCPNGVCIEGTSCIAECSFSNWNRAYKNTVMRDSYLNRAYRKVNEDRLQEVLNRYE